MRVVFDTQLRRPACAILQAALGGDANIATLFPSESWLTSPTDDMSCFEVDERQLGILIVMANEGLSK
jgi:hypothetical protein